MDEIIKSFGFPVACAIGLAWFVLFLIRRQDKQAKEQEEAHQKEVDKKDTLIANKDEKLSELTERSIKAIENQNSLLGDFKKMLEKK